jgi:pimeloyl-ACP methyl ester carboxylesterase
MHPPPYPVIVVPGITASYLRDDYTIPPDFVWTVLTQDYERAALHPDDLRYEALEPARVQSDQLFEIAYKELIEELRFNLRQAEDEPVPVYPFGYDWRQPLDWIEARLATFVDEVIERTKLIRHYRDAGFADDPKVNLLGHSMGGLVIAGFLERTGRAARVHKVATLATPFQGSFEAVIKVTTGTANLGAKPPSSREREAARMTPALYHLMPTFETGIVPAGASLFEAGNWQRSVPATIEEFIRLRGAISRNRTERRRRAIEVFEHMLDTAKKHRARTDAFKLRNAGLGARDWLCVVGVGAVTRVRLRIEKQGRWSEFAFRSADRQDLWEITGDKLDELRERGFLDPGGPLEEKQINELRRFTGDGTVPFEGAVPKFLGLENLICVTPEDYGYWEIPDRVFNLIGGFHGILPNMNMLHRLVVRHFTGRDDRHGNTWGRPAPGVARMDWRPAIENLRDKSAR